LPHVSFIAIDAWTGLIDDLTGMLSASSLLELRRPTSGLMKDEPDEANTRALLEKA
jgi:hypothetical protein